MAREQIKLRYSGFIIFLFRIISIGTGLLFTLMVTRSISPEEYGILGNLGDILSYFTLTSAIIPFWVTRFAARRQSGSFKTGFNVNTLIGFISTAIYVLSIPIIMNAIRISWEYLPAYLAASIIIFESHILAIFEAAIYPKRPENLGFGLFVFEVSKLVLGYLLIFMMKMSLMGVLSSIIAASIAQMLFYLRYLSHEFREKAVRAYIRRWLKASLLNVYGILSGRILMLANIFLFIYGGELSRAYYGASSAIASVIGYSSFLSSALYPKLLSSAESRDVVFSLKMVLMLAIPMSLGAVALSENLLAILNPVYSVAKPILVILSANAFFSALSSIFESIISGTEKIDTEPEILYGKMIRSRLFLLLTLHYVQAAAVVPFVYLVLKPLAFNALEATLYFALINTVVVIPLTLAKYVMARKCIAFKIPWESVGKYFCAALPMTAVVLILEAPARLTLTVLRALIGASIYFLVLSAIDKETREIIRLIRKEVWRILRIEAYRDEKP
ncbi:MAG: hypothetical protein N3E47_06635 [Candidatus Bathyarchaeota archaeon]|nr:hypothetical protein [Candidatus Bathyarchaeota archaeon]